MEEHLYAVKKNMEKVTPKDSERERVRKAAEELDKGKEAIWIRQKHIRIVDCSDWGVVTEYLAD